jgi:transposase-like protein
MVVCPSCGSSRIRNDYKPAPLALRLIGVRALLCDYCNRQFRAFSPTPPRARASSNTTRKLDIPRSTTPFIHNHVEPPSKEEVRLELQASRLFLTIESSQDEQIKIDLSGFATRKEPKPVNGNGSHALVPSNLRSEVAMAQDLPSVKETQGLKAVREKHKTSVTCPECGSNWVRRRQRSGLERVVFALTNHKAFICRSCDASFYARIADEGGASNVISRSAQT